MEDRRQEEVLQAIKSRRSIRKYRKEQITEEQLNAILEAGTYAPTGMGMQSPVIVAIQKPELIEKLSKMNAAVMGSSSDPFYGAPTVLVVLADPERRTYVEDGSLVMGALLLAAHAVGVDSCWIHRAKEEFESEEGKALLREWGIPENYVGIGHCILGYRDCEYPDPKPRKENYIVRV
ncbi:MAG: nitroreductase family protein [Fusicatenibacter sp.]|nr:nitroreductase [Fusicatenibacter sp.]